MVRVSFSLLSCLLVLANLSAAFSDGFPGRSGCGTLEAWLRFVMAGWDCYAWCSCFRQCQTWCSTFWAARFSAACQAWCTGCWAMFGYEGNSTPLRARCSSRATSPTTPPFSATHSAAWRKTMRRSSPSRRPSRTPSVAMCSACCAGAGPAGGGGGGDMFVSPSGGSGTSGQFDKSILIYMLDIGTNAARIIVVAISSTFFITIP